MNADSPHFERENSNTDQPVNPRRRNPSRLLVLSLIAACLAYFLHTQTARAAPLGFDLEPIIGYEKVQKYRPTTHSTSRMFYGARASAGLLLLSLETEYTRAQDETTFADTNTTVRDTTDRLKLGLRSTFKLGPILSLFARGGVQASRTRYQELVNNVMTTNEYTPTKYKPYAGTGLQFKLSRRFILSGGITVVFNNFPKMAENDYQPTLGFVLKLP